MDFESGPVDYLDMSVLVNTYIPYKITGACFLSTLSCAIPLVYLLEMYE